MDQFSITELELSEGENLKDKNIETINIEQSTELKLKESEDLRKLADTQQLGEHPRPNTETDLQV